MCVREERERERQKKKETEGERAKRKRVCCSGGNCVIVFIFLGLVLGCSCWWFTWTEKHCDLAGHALTPPGDHRALGKICFSSKTNRELQPVRVFVQILAFLLLSFVLLPFYIRHTQISLNLHHCLLHLIFYSGWEQQMCYRTDLPKCSKFTRPN